MKILKVLMVASILFSAALVTYASTAFTRIYYRQNSTTPVTYTQVTQSELNCPGGTVLCGFSFDNAGPASWDTFAEARVAYEANAATTDHGEHIFVNGVDTGIIVYKKAS